MEKTLKTKKVKREVSKTLANKLTQIAQKQYEAGIRFKQPRMLEIQENENLYNNKVKKAPKGRFNVPLPVMGGFIDTLMSKIDDAPSIQYEHDNLAYYTKAQKISSAWKKDSSPTMGRWGAKDRASKRTAATSGVGIFELYAESDPEYKSCLSIVDPIDFYCEPLGGAWLENHIYCGKDNVFRSNSELRRGVEAGIYDADQVEMLTSSGNGNGDQKRVRELFQNRANRMRELGLDPNNYNFAGEKVYSLVAHCIDYDGKRYFILFDYDTGIWVRCQTMEKAFGTRLYPFVAWHTHPDELNFWSKAPADDIRPVAESINIIFNQALDNRQKRNFGMRAVDGAIFEDLSQLEWRPDGLAQGNTNGGERRLADGVYEFQTAEVTGTVDMIQFMDNFVGTKTGITASAQGDASTDKVGIYYGDMQEVADRLGLYNKSYSDAWSELGLRYVVGIEQHMTEGYMIRMIGENGITHEEITREDAMVDSPYSIKPIGGQAEIRANTAKKNERIASLDKILANQNLASQINPKWAIQEILKAADYDDDQVQTATDLTNDGDIYSLSEASKAIQTILRGERPKMYRNATLTFCQRIINFATDKVYDPKQYDMMLEYAMAHVDIAQENGMRKLMTSANMGKSVAPGTTPTAPAPEEQPPAGTPEGTQSESALATEALAPVA